MMIVSDARPIRLWFRYGTDEVSAFDVEGMQRMLLKVREDQGWLEALARELTERIAMQQKD